MKKPRKILTQKEMFWQSHSELAAANNLRMARLQREAGREDRAKEFEAMAQKTRNNPERQ